MSARLASSNDVIRRALALVAEEVDETAAAQQLATIAGSEALEDAVGHVLVGLARNPLVDVTGIRTARVLRTAAQLQAPALAQAS